LQRLKGVGFLVFVGITLMAMALQKKASLLAGLVVFAGLVLAL